MVLLDSTMKLQAYTTATPSTPLQYYLHYSDFASTFNYDALLPKVGTFNQTQTDIVDSVGAGKFRAVKSLNIYNGSDGTQEVNIVIDIAGADTKIFTLLVASLSYLVYNGDTWQTSKTLTIGADLLTISAQSANPTPPGVDTLLLYNLPLAGRQLLRVLGTSGVDTALQPALFGNGIIMVSPYTTATFNVIGTVLPTSVGAVSTPALTSTSLRTSSRRAQVLSAATANSASEVRIAYASVWRGNGAGLGGFFYRARVAIGSSVANQRLLIGLTSSTAATATTQEPSALTNIICFGNDLADTNYQIMVNDGTGTATKVDTGFTKSVINEIFDVTFFCAPNSSSIGYSISRLNDGVNFEGVLSSDLPVSTTFLAPHLYLNNGGTAAAVTLDVMKIYIETDQ